MAATLCCQACGHGHLRTLAAAPGIPVHSCLMIPEREAALGYRRGDLELAFCSVCGFVQNSRFDSSVHDYSPRYEETQAFSPRFRRFVDGLIERLLDRYDLRGKTVLEIGCGKGEFLVRLCELGGGRGIGYDPGYRPERTVSPAANRIEFVRDFWGPRHAGVSADLVVCRHTLEHIQPVRDFVAQVRATIDGTPDTLVFFELPDVRRILERCAFEDVYYEHCSYFSTGSLARLLRRCGFDPLELWTDYGDQYVLLVARPGAGEVPPLEAEDDLAALAHAADHYATELPVAVDRWRSRVGAARAAGQRVVLWGSGSKAVSFLTTTGAGDAIEYVVDINPHKHGMFLAATGQEIVGPELLADYQPGLIIAMNAMYVPEIRDDCARLGVEAELTAV